MLAVARDRAVDLHNRLLVIVEACRVADAQIAALLFDMHSDRLYHDLGYASLVAYGQSLQLSARKTKELVKIAARLHELPALAEAFGQGTLAWTKARELVRVAVPETDAAWVAHAEQLTCRELERDVTACSPGDAPPSLDDPPKDPPVCRLVVQLHGVDAQMVNDAIAWAMASANLQGEEQDRGAASRRWCAVASRRSRRTRLRRASGIEWCWNTVRSASTPRARRPRSTRPWSPRRAVMPRPSSYGTVPARAT